MSRFSLAPLILLGAATGIGLAGCGGSSGGGSNPAPLVTQSITGQVVDNDTFAPIDGATVQVSGITTPVTTKDLSPSVQGTYTVTGLYPTRSYTLTVSAPGYVTASAKLLSANTTLQAPLIILQKATQATTIQNTGGSVTSNATLDGNTASLTIPANALPGGAASAGISATLITGTAVPGAPTDSTKIAYPAFNVGVTGATGNFAQAVTVTLPLPFPMTSGATVPVLMQAADGSWAPINPPLTATVGTAGTSASFTTAVPGTYAFSLTLQATASLSGTPQVTPVPGPYTDPMIIPVSAPTVTWAAQAGDAQDALSSAFVQGQRRGTLSTGPIVGDLDGAPQLVVHPRGTSLIEVVKDNLNVTFTSNGFTIQQAAQNTITGLAHYEIVPHQQGSGSGS